MESLAAIYARHSTPSGVGDKGTLHSYIDVYERLLAPMRLHAQRILEIGVAQGHSLRMWREYFPHAEIIGVDCEPCDVAGCIVIRGDATRRSTYLGVGNLDLVIDDGSHDIEQQVRAFNILAPHLGYHGVYVIEDVQCYEESGDRLRALPGYCETHDGRGRTGVVDDVMCVYRPWQST